MDKKKKVLLKISFAGGIGPEIGWSHVHVPLMICNLKVSCILTIIPYKLYEVIIILIIWEIELDDL